MSLLRGFIGPVVKGGLLVEFYDLGFHRKARREVPLVFVCLVPVLLVHPAFAVQAVVLIGAFLDDADGRPFCLALAVEVAFLELAS